MNTAAETLVAGLAVEEIAEDEEPVVEVAVAVAAVGATVVNVVEQVVKELGMRDSFEPAFVFVAFVHSGAMGHMASSCVHD